MVEPWVARDRYVRPPSLAEYLAQGGSIDRFPLLASLVEAVVVGRRVFPPEVNRRQAARNRAYVERWFERHGDEQPVQATQDLLTFAAWKAECLEDESLAERFERSIPRPLLEEKLRLLDDLRRSHPLTVRELQTTWTCRACGCEQRHSPALLVTGTASAAGEDLTYCVSCVSIASAALEAACGLGDLLADLTSQGLRLPPSDGPEAPRPGVTAPGVTGPGVTGPGATGPGATGPGATGPGATGPAPGAEAEEPVEDEIVLPSGDEVRPPDVRLPEVPREDAARLMMEIEETRARLEALETERSRLVRRILGESSRRTGRGGGGRGGSDPR